MSALTRISVDAFARALDAAKARGSGAIIIDTPSASEPRDTVLSFTISVGGSEPSMLGLLDALDRQAGASSGASAGAARDLLRRNTAPLYYTAETRLVLDRICEVLAEYTGRTPILVRYASVSAFDAFSILIIRRILDRSDGITMTFLLPCALPSDPPPAETDCLHLYWLMELCVQIKMWNRAGIVLEEVLRARSRVFDEGLRGRIAFRAGMIHARRGLVETAREDYETAVRHLTAAGDHQSLVKALNNLGNMLLQKENFDEADRYFSQALGLGEELQNDYHLAVTYGNYAHLMYRQGRPEHAIANLRKALNFTARSGYYRQAHYNYADMGDYQARLGRDDEALAAYAKASRICELQGNVPDGAECQIRIARLHLSRGRREEAERALTQAESVYRRIGHAWGLMTVLDATAELRLAENNHAAAENLLEEADLYARDLGEAADRRRRPDPRAEVTTL